MLKIKCPLIPLFSDPLQIIVFVFLLSIDTDGPNSRSLCRTRVRDSIIRSAPVLFLLSLSLVPHPGPLSDPRSLIIQDHRTAADMLSYPLNFMQTRSMDAPFWTLIHSLQALRNEAQDPADYGDHDKSCGRSRNCLQVEVVFPLSSSLPLSSLRHFQI